LGDLRQVDDESISRVPENAVPSDKSLQALKKEVRKRSEKRGKPSSPLKNI
jgi:hypothetical protein